MKAGFVSDSEQTRSDARTLIPQAADGATRRPRSSRKVKTSRGIDIFSPVHARSRPPRSGPRPREGGDTAGARKAYQDFFALWKDADPDLPVLVEARREYETT